MPYKQTLEELEQEVAELKDMIKDYEELQEMLKFVEGQKKEQETINEGEYKCPKNCSCINSEGMCNECVIFDVNEAFIKVSDYIKSKLLTKEIKE